jgi:hypothetical protein
MAERQLVATLMAAGATKLRMPNPDEERARFDAELVAEPRQIPVEEIELRRALGVA